MLRKLTFLFFVLLSLLAVGCNIETSPLATEEHMQMPFSLHFSDWDAFEKLETALKQGDEAFEKAFSDTMSGDIRPETAAEMKRVYAYLKSLYIPVLIPTAETADYFADDSPSFDFFPNGNNFTVGYRLGGSHSDNRIFFSCSAYMEFPKTPTEEWSRYQYQDLFWKAYGNREDFVSSFETGSFAYSFTADDYEGRMFLRQDNERYCKGYFITENTWVSVSLQTADEEHVDIFHSIFRDGIAPYTLTVAPLGELLDTLI